MLFIVPTPIGNLADITQRAVDILGEVDFIMAEDTRTTGILLKHLEISKPMIAYHQHNEHKILEKVISRLRTASARPMRRLIAKGGCVPAVKISTGPAPPQAKAQTQPADTQHMKASAAWVTP